MAEFVEVMKMAKRMCESIDNCDDCLLLDASTELCYLDKCPKEYNDSDLIQQEAAIMKWDAENPEVRNPTWREWQAKKFPGRNLILTPCHFMMMQEWMGISGCDCRDCDVCSERPIPAETPKSWGLSRRRCEHGQKNKDRLVRQHMESRNRMFSQLRILLREKDSGAIRYELAPGRKPRYI